MTKKISQLTAAGALDGSEQIEVVQGGVSKRATAAALAALAGEGAWQLDIDEDGSSSAGLTTISGTWSSAGGVIKNTDTGASKMAHFGTLLDMPVPMVAEVECRIPSNTGGDQYVGMHMISGASAASHLCTRVAFVSGVWRKQIATTGTNTVDLVDGDGAFGTWRTLRLYSDGAAGTAWLDGVILGSSTGNSNNLAIGGLAFFSAGASVEFRNFRRWSRGDLPV